MNRYLTYQDGELLFEDVALSEIAEDMYTPFYVYSKAAILEKVEAFKQAFADLKPMMAYSLKALDTTLIAKILEERGCAIEVSNPHELERALAIGFKPTTVIYNSYGLPEHKIPDILKQKPLLINVGNVFELEPLNRYAKELDSGVRIGLRLNMGIEAHGFPGMEIGGRNSSVGIQPEDVDLAVALVKTMPQLNLVGISCRLGSQISQLAPWIKMSEDMAKQFKWINEQGFNLEYLDLGGGFPVAYDKMDYLEIKKIARNIIPHVKDLDCRVILEPGRYFTAEAGALVTTVLGVKETPAKFYIICDAGAAELPYSVVTGTNCEVVPVKEVKTCSTEPGGAFDMGAGSGEPTDIAANVSAAGEMLPRFDIPSEFMTSYEASKQFGTKRPLGEPAKCDIIGPGGEAMDYLARDIDVCIPKRGDLLAVLNVGAYGRTMSSNFQSRVRPVEILIERDKFEIIRSREQVEDLLACDLEESEIED